MWAIAKALTANLYPCPEEGWIVLRSLAQLLTIYAGALICPEFRLDPNVTPGHLLKNRGFSSISSTHSQVANPGNNRLSCSGEISMLMKSTEQRRSTGVDDQPQKPKCE